MRTAAAHGTLPRNNAEWWAAKLHGNVERDRRNDDALREAGWTPLRFWEHEDAAAAADTVQTAWEARTGAVSDPAPGAPGLCGAALPPQRR